MINAVNVTLYVLVDHTLESIQSLDDPESVTPFVAIQLFLRYRHRHFDVYVSDIISHPSDIEQTHDIGHATQYHACGHQSFGSPGASHADIPTCSVCLTISQRKTRQQLPSQTWNVGYFSALHTSLWTSRIQSSLCPYTAMQSRTVLSFVSSKGGII